jgi:carbamoyl-phosphate synthase large subunit
MKSTGEVMGIDATFGAAFAKSQMAAGQRIPAGGSVFVSVKNMSKRGIVPIARHLADIGFRIVATEGTARALVQAGIPVTQVAKVSEGVRPNVLDLIKNGEVQLIVNLPQGKGPRSDNYAIRCAAVIHRIPCVTTLSGAQALMSALESTRQKALSVKPLQEYHSA